MCLKNTTTSLVTILLLSVAQTAVYADDSHASEREPPAGISGRPVTATPAQELTDLDKALSNPASNANSKAQEFEDVPQNDLNDAKNRYHMGSPLLKHVKRATRIEKLRYYFVAQNTANCDIFYGLVADNPLIGLASVNFSFPNGCECHGHALVTHYNLFGGAAGQKGWIHAKCSDGRTLKGNFTTTSLTTGQWSATDSLGNQYEGSFGHAVDEAVARVNEIRKNLHCQSCNPVDIELSVQAQIMHKPTAERSAPTK